MKKYFALLLLTLYIFSANCSWAVSKLYILKDTQKEIIEPKTKSVLILNDFTIKKEDPTYAVSDKDSSNYVVLAFMQSGQNLLYYIETSDENKKLNKKILKCFRQSDIEYEESYNQLHIDSFKRISADSITGAEKKYDFEIPEPQFQQVITKTKPKDDSKYQGFVGRIEKGTKLNVYLQTPINTATAVRGDNVVAVLKENWTFNNSVVAPEGSVIYGNVSKARQASIGTRNGAVSFVFDKIVTPQGKQIIISTDSVDFNVTDDGKFQRIASTTLTSAVIGGIVGLGLAALFGHGGSSLAEGAIVGASIGGGGALISSVSERGIDAEIPSYTELEIVLNKPTDVVLTY